MKYDHDISPSTKEETELHLALLKEKSAKIANKSKESPNVQESDKSKKKRQGNH